MRALLTLLFATTLVGCASTPAPLLTPRAAAATEPLTLQKSELLQQTNHSTRHLNADKTIVFTQNFGGGGAGLGLLLGPIGVAANIAMIEKATQADAKQLSDKLRVNPWESFKQAWPAEAPGLAAAKSEHAPSIAPYLYVVRVDEQRLQLAAAFLVEQGQGAGKWTGRYLFQLPGSYTVEALSSLDEARTNALQQEMVGGFKALARFYLGDRQEALATEPKMLFKSSFVTPRFEFEMLGALAQEQADVVWLRTVGGVFALRKDAVTLRPAS